MFGFTSILFPVVYTLLSLCRLAGVWHFDQTLLHEEAADAVAA